MLLFSQSRFSGELSCKHLHMPFSSDKIPTVQPPFVRDGNKDLKMNYFLGLWAACGVYQLIAKVSVLSPSSTIQDKTIQCFFSLPFWHT